MPVSLPNKKSADRVTSGEIMAGVVWLVIFGLIIFGSLSHKSEQLMAAINLSGLW
jgi:hypothetical protein